jgi:hypothetical protein
MMNMMLWLFFRRHIGTRVGPNRSEPTERLKRSADVQPIGISRILLNPGGSLGAHLFSIPNIRSLFA